MKKITHTQQEDKQENIILDDDITISKGKDEGRKLSEVLDEQTTQINKLSSNIKWLYKYGGVGSGSGGGGGTGGGSWSAQLMYNERVLRDGDTLNLGKPGYYKFKVQIYNGGNSTYNIVYTYTDSKKTHTESDLALAQNGFSSTKNLYLDTNSALIVKITNQDMPDEAPVTFNIPYVINAYKFDLQYVYADNHQPVNFTNNTIFMSGVQEKGLQVQFTSNIGVAIARGSYTYVGWDGVQRPLEGEEEDPIEGNEIKKIYLDLIDGDIYQYLLNDNNAGFKQFFLNIDLTLKGELEPENIPQLSLKDNLIPSNLYLKVSVSGNGTIYEQEQSDYPEYSNFSLGNISFMLTPYNGDYDSSETYHLTITNQVKNEQNEWVNDVQYEGIDTLQDQRTSSVSITVNQSGEHKINFTISSNLSSAVEPFSKDYYFYVNEDLSRFEWYEEEKSVSRLSYYRYTKGVENVTGGIDKDKVISMGITSTPKTYNFNIQNPQSLNNYDQFISIGIQYSDVNDVNQPIASINAERAGTIFIFQNKVLISQDNTPNTGTSREIFFPFSKEFTTTNPEGYHLITIYRRYDFTDQNKAYKTISIYIDGIFENVFNGLSEDNKKYTGITFYGANYYSNLFEYSLISHGQTENNDYYNGLSPVRFLTDNDMVYYYYSYKSKILYLNIEEEERDLYLCFKDLREDRDNFILTNNTGITNIANNSKIPVMILHSIDSDGKVGDVPLVGTQYGVDNFKLWMSQNFSTKEYIDKVPVTVDWKGKSDITFRTIRKPNNNVATFFVSPQGTSTLAYRSKNFELFAPESDTTGRSYIYSPNFKHDDFNTFLPEQSFTLKADVVDSSHTNNNAIGKFVNENTTKFEKAKQISSNYSGYIKNCLVGESFLLFLHTQYLQDSASHDYIDKFYFLGIYNFNLGRKSYYNLGYKDLANLDNIEGGIKDGFNIYEISDYDNVLLNSVVVAEVQDNDNFWDFSQSDASILFSMGSSDKKYMFGDIVDGHGSSGDTAKKYIQNLVDRISLCGGYIFKEIGKQFLNDGTYGYDDGYSVPNQVPNYLYVVQRKPAQTSGDYDYEYNSTPRQPATEANFENLIIDKDEAGNESYRLLDYTSLCEYYTTCMAFGMIDSVEKNLNIKCWNATSTDEEQIKASNNPTEALFYLAFYDMDTALGVSNSGFYIDYFAFSDYWESNYDEYYNLQPTIVKRDYAPKNSGYTLFDIPSSYLFAIAKYAYFVKSGMQLDNNSLIDHPSNLWAKWRNSNGCLRDANYFMETYFNDHLKDVPYSAYNYNYRYKYFIKSQGSTIFEADTLTKFHGRKTAHTENWLNGRFHLLDAYFNLNGLTEYMGGYYAPQANRYVDYNNSDIYVLHDIFTDITTGKKYPETDKIFLIQASDLAPLIIKTDTTGQRYLCLNSQDSYNVHMKNVGNQSILFGASILWTYIDNIEPFIDKGNVFQIKSKFIETIKGADGTCDSWNIEAPSLKELYLTSPNYTGNLTFIGNDNTPYSNFNKITISNTGLGLFIDNIKIEQLYAQNMQSGSSITITNDQVLSSVSVSGTMQSLTIPAWQQNITFNGFNCETIAIDNRNYSNNKLTIINNKILTSLVATGFSEIEISECPNLSVININEGSTDSFKLKKLSVVMNESTTHETFTLNSNNINEVDLEAFSLLNEIKFNYCKMRNVKMPLHDIILKSKAFYGCSKLQYLSSNYNCFISGSEIFAKCPSFTLKQNSEENAPICPLYLMAQTTSIEKLFSTESNLYNDKGSITLKYASKFLKENCKNNNYVTNINSIFYNQDIEYGLSDMILEYNNCQNAYYNPGSSDIPYWEYCSLSLYNFANVTNASQCFLGNKISGYNRYMFTGLGRNIGENNALRVSNIIGEFSVNDPSPNERWYGGYHILYATTDFLYEIMDKIETLSVRNYATDNSYLYFIQNLSNFLSITNNFQEDISLGNEIFKNGSIYPIKLKNLTQFEVYPEHNIDFENMFWYEKIGDEHRGWVAAGKDGLSLSGFFYYGGNAYQKFSHIDNLLKHIKLISASSTLRGFLKSDYIIDMYNFLNWEDIDNTTNLFYSEIGYESLGFNKTITYSQFHYVWNKILNSNMLTQLGFLFKNCNITSDREITEFKITEENLVNDRIVDTYCLFDNCKIVKTDNVETLFPMNITHDFFICLPKLRNVPFMFRDTYWGNPIPFDFFRKRKETTQAVYVGDTVGSRQAATLYTYTYDREMVMMQSCFRNIGFEGEKCFKCNGSYNKGKCVENRAVVNGAPGEIYYEYYYADTEDAEKQYVIRSTEYLDAFNAENMNNYDYSAGFTVGSNQFTNWPTCASIGEYGCFVAPDIFYGMASTDPVDRLPRNITFALGVDNGKNEKNHMSGLIPENLLKPIKDLTPTNLFVNLNLLPWYIDDTIITENETSRIYKIYCYIPSNFTTNANLKSVFNFHLILPNANAYTKYYVLSTDSISRLTTTLENGLPGSTSDDINHRSIIGVSAGYPNTAITNYHIKYNVMVEKIWVYEIIQEVPTGETYETVQLVPSLPSQESPKYIYNETDGNFYEKKFKPREGINMNMFTVLKLNNLINVPLSFFLDGRLFTEGTLTKQMWDANYDDYFEIDSPPGTTVVSIGTSTTSGSGSGLSMNAKLPLTYYNNKFIKRSRSGQNYPIYINYSSVEGGTSEDYQASGNYPNITFTGS